LNDTEQQPLDDKPFKKKVAAKPRADVESFAQLLIYAYGLKGRKVTLKSKAEKQVAKNLLINPVEQEQIQLLIKSDVILSVPRQLLLLAIQTQSCPQLRKALRDFVYEVLRTHALFQRGEIQLFFSNVDETLKSEDVLKLLSASEQQFFTEESIKALKPNVFVQLKNNAVNCMAIWLVGVKGLTVSMLSDALFAGHWKLGASALKNDNDIFRAITDIPDAAVVGVVCHEYQRIAKDKQLIAERAESQLWELKNQITEHVSINEKLEAEIERQKNSITENISEHAKQLDLIKHKHEIECVHLREDAELLRTRVVRRLTSDLELLENSLEALRRPAPKTHVAIDAMERVSDALRKELVFLKGEK